MAGGNKKKKKPAANPARGFATTSIASKPKADVNADSVIEGKTDKQSTTASKQNAETPPQPSDTASKTADAKELHELTPEELEAQLEASELQQFVERHAAKVKKESARQISRLQTDKRLLRSQADFLSLKDWLPEELIQQIVDLTKLEKESDAEVSNIIKAASADEFASRVWVLRQCLLGLDIPIPLVSKALEWLVAHPPSIQASSQGWGIDECLEWLALNCEPSELEDYDYQKPKAALIADDDEGEESPRDDVKAAATIEKPGQTPALDESPADDGPAVSDLESDLEPDELRSVWLKTKARLYEINPDIAEGQAKKGKGKMNTSTPGLRQTRQEQQLRQRLSKIESDVLFDQQDAEFAWSNEKIILAREAAERRKLNLQEPSEQSTRLDQPVGNDVNDEAERIAQELLAEVDSDGEGNLLGGMFDSLPGVQQTQNGDDGSTSGPVTIRDFGKMTGMSPKRVLEEACKSRDGRCRISYKQVSQTTYACRHGLTIHWNKDQIIMDFAFLTAVRIKSKPGQMVFTMAEIATPDPAQSEAYVATVALFVIFAGSPKEEKAHLRLPSAFRDLWDELTALRSAHVLAEDGVVAKEVRQIIEKNRASGDDDKEEVVFDVSSRRRVDGATSTSTPDSQNGTTRQATSQYSQELQDMWNRKRESPAYQRMLLGRQNLPMFQFRDEALDIIRRNRVTILCGETGCGKSTQLPAFILEDELSQGRPCKIYCTEPRRISAISLAQRVCEEMGGGKGDVGTSRSLVGYAVRLESHVVSQTRLVYATVGIVLRMLENSDGLSDITHLVIDEVHERTIDTDFLLIILRTLMVRRPDLKVVLMSATVDAQRFSQYLDNAPIINVPGRTFPVKAFFLEDAIEITGHTNEDATSNAVDDEVDDDDQPKDGGSQQLEGYSRSTQKTLAEYDEYRIDFSLIVKLLEKIAQHAQYDQYSKAILVFLPGIAEIRQLNDMLGGHPRFNKGWKVYPLHSTFSSEDQQAAFEVPPPGIRKIVLATNIAETGITIPDVTCVIDTGKHKEMRFDERRQMSRLIQSFIARANAKQRRGRAGRVQEGICFHLFTKHRHDHLMVDQQTPEMLRLSLQDLVMRVKICKLGAIEYTLAQALDPPSSKNVRRAIDALVEVGALTTGEDLTPLGSQLAKLPLDAQLGKLVILGCIFGCLDFTLTAAASLSSKSPFLSPMHQKKQADTVRLGFRRGDSDLLTVYNAYISWRRVCQTPGLSEYQFCGKNFLSPQNMANIEDLKGQLLSSLLDAGFVQLGHDERAALTKMRHHSRQRNFIALPERYCRADSNDLIATSVVAWSLYPKILKQDGKGWRNIANNQSLALHPTSVNKSSSSDAKYLSFYSILQSSSRFTNAQETSAVSDVALALLAGEAVFSMYAGVVVVDGNRLKFKLRDWRTMIALKTLRSKVREVLAKLLRNPGRELGDRPRKWMDIVEGIFERLQPAHVAPSVQVR